MNFPIRASFREFSETKGDKLKTFAKFVKVAVHFYSGSLQSKKLVFTNRIILNKTGPL